MIAYLQNAWSSLRRKPALILSVMLIYGLSYLAGNALPAWLLPKMAHRFWYFLVGALVLLWEAWWNGALLLFLTRQLNGQKLQLKDLFTVPGGAWGGLFVLNLLRIAVVVLVAVPVVYLNTGSMARILPVILILLALIFVTWYNVRFGLAAARVVAYKRDVFDAMIDSWKATQGRFLRALGCLVIVFGIGFSGILLLEWE